VTAITAVGWVGGIGSLRAARAAHASAGQQADLQVGAWLRAHVGGGRVLMELSANEAAAFAVPPGQVVDEASNGWWEQALRDPWSHRIRWIYMRRSDDVWNRLHGSAGPPGYVLAYSTPDRRIYERQRS
jgi:hypothetical protein